MQPGHGSARLRTMQRRASADPVYVRQFGHMLEFREYVAQLQELARHESPSEVDEAVAAALNGEAAVELRERVSLEKRREAGAFFSPPDVVASVRERLRSDVGPSSVIFDPACGAGDLLLGAARLLGGGEYPLPTLRQWSNNLLGVDLYSEFVDAARARLVLLARSLSAGRRLAAGAEARSLQGIRVASGLDSSGPYQRSTHVVMNPPFSGVATPAGIPWSSGRVSLAAVFVWTAATQMSPGARLIAVVPDVLRSGARYRQFRQSLSDLGELAFPVKHGRFDPFTDVHTSLLELRIGQSANTQQQTNPAQLVPTIGTKFKVHVGPVVPHRLSNRGTWRPFLYTGNCPRWGSVDSRDQSVRFTGTVFRPPLVVVRRTSRPEDASRAVTTLVLIDQEVAIENHLIVLIPRDGSVSSCSSLIRLLRKESTSAWLNERIRCRHLTVRSVAEIPWCSEE